MRSIIMNEQVEDDIRRVLDYCWDDEKKNWLEAGEDCDHIYSVLRRLAAAIQYEPRS